MTDRLPPYRKNVRWQLERALQNLRGDRRAEFAFGAILGITVTMSLIDHDQGGATLIALGMNRELALQIAEAIADWAPALIDGAAGLDALVDRVVKLAAAWPRGGQ